MKNNKINYYRKRQNEIRNEAIDFQMDDFQYSYGGLLMIQEYFEKFGKRYGLLREFKNEGII